MIEINEHQFMWHIMDIDCATTSNENRYYQHEQLFAQMMGWA